MIGLDFDGVVADLTYVKEELGKDFLPEEEAITVSNALLPPVSGVEEVLYSGKVKAIVSKRKFKTSLMSWFKYWFGGVPSGIWVFCIGSRNKVDIVKELNLKVFVDDNWFIVSQLKAVVPYALWFDVKVHGNLYSFLRKKGVLK